MMTSYDPLKHHRRSIRHPQNDYSSSGVYFVTVCTKWHACVLDDPVVTGICIDVWQALSGWFPTIVLDEFVIMPNHTHFIMWLATVGAGLAPALAPAQHDAHAYTGATARVRPYASQQRIHVYKGDHERHTNENEAIAIPHDWEIPIPQTTKMNPTLGNVVGAWKSLVANTYLDWINKHALDRQAKFWQRNYYDRIIRNNRALEAVNGYIDDIKRHPHP